MLALLRWMLRIRVIRPRKRRSRSGFVIYYYIKELAQLLRSNMTNNSTSWMAWPYFDISPQCSQHTEFREMPSLISIGFQHSHMKGTQVQTWKVPLVNGLKIGKQLKIRSISSIMSGHMILLHNKTNIMSVYVCRLNIVGYEIIKCEKVRQC